MMTFVLFLVMYYLGYARAHYVVAHECKMLGKFYVGKKVYHCDRIEDTSVH